MFWDRIAAALANNGEGTRVIPRPALFIFQAPDPRAASIGKRLFWHFHIYIIPTPYLGLKCVAVLVDFNVAYGIDRTAPVHSPIPCSHACG